MGRLIKSQSRLHVAPTLLATALLLVLPFDSQGRQSDACAGHGLSGPVETVPGEAVAELARLVDRRLSYMDEVAAYKWAKGLPIEDLARERIVIENSLQSAARHHLEPNSVRPFFERQIVLAKSIQARWFERWERTSFDARHVQDLAGQIRPELLRLGDRILAVVFDLAPWRLPQACLEQLAPIFIDGVTTEAVSREQKLRLFRAIQTIHPREAEPKAQGHPDDSRSCREDELADTAEAHSYAHDGAQPAGS